MRVGTEKARKFAKQLRRRMTNAETILWLRLRGNQLFGLRFRRQHPVGPFIADFACSTIKLIVEIDGETHGTREVLRHDERRTRFLETRGWTVVRAYNVDVYDNLHGVLEQIAETSINLKRAQNFPHPITGVNPTTLNNNKNNLPPHRKDGQ